MKKQTNINSELAKNMIDNMNNDFFINGKGNHLKQNQIKKTQNNKTEEK
jgi:hypothetical protein